MLKKIVATSAAVLMVAGAAGAASAATRNINLYGASAQYLFWNDAADDFLGTKGCSNIQQAEYDSKNGITKGEACSSYGGDDVIIRYSAKASFDGIMATKGLEHPDASTTCTNKAQRPMVTDISAAALSCQDVVLGASDVAAQAFTQISSGQKLGPLGGGSISRDFVSNPVDGSGLTTFNPLVVPFAPFVSNNVTMMTCDGGDLDGEMCASVSDCPGATSCTAKSLDNISREMMVEIFSGQAFYWNDFGAGFPAEPITVCLRHAGSGTHATLDHAVMNKKWGAGLLQAESAADPIAYFNDGSSDEMKCISSNKGAITPAFYAIGYADADQLLAKPEYAPYVYSPKYNGFAPTRVNIRNGLYDWWSAQWMYMDPNEDSAIKAVVTDLVAYAANPANIPTTKAKYWAAQDEMVWFKDSDTTYPGYRGAAIPQTP
jgi:hypothetical protein